MEIKVQSYQRKIYLRKKIQRLRDYITQIIEGKYKYYLVLTSIVGFILKQRGKDKQKEKERESERWK